MRILAFVQPLLALALLSASCTSGGTSVRALPSAAANGLNVIATFSISGDLLQNVAGEYVSLTVLAGPGADTHTYQPTPRDGAAMSKADLIFEIGLGFEPWLDRMVDASGTAARRVILTEGLRLRYAAAEPFLPSNGIRRAVPGGAAADGQGPVGAPDPHVWQSVGHVMEMVEAMRDALMEADASHAEIYRARAEQFLLQLGELDAWAFEQTASLPAEQRRLVTNHDSLGYFAERYGFELLGSLLPLSTEAGSASAQNIARLVDLIKASGVPAIFGESISSDRLLQQVAREAGVEAVGSLYTDSLGPPGSTAETYQKMMRHNVETIVGALGGDR